MKGSQKQKQKEQEIDTRDKDREMREREREGERWKETVSKREEKHYKNDEPQVHGGLDSAVCL